MSIKYCISALLVLGWVAVAGAGSIGVNFVGKNAENSTLEATAKAGADGVAQANWNNLQVGSDDANGHNNSGAMTGVVDGEGKKLDDVTVKVDATDKTQVWPTAGAAWGFEGANLTLQSGLLWPQPRITITGIPYKKYEVHLYCATGDNAGLGSAKISVASGAEGKVDEADTYFYKIAWLNGRFVKSAAKTLEDAQKTDGSNYIVFVGNTASAITIDWNGAAGGSWTGASGIQIVEVTE